MDKLPVVVIGAGASGMMAAGRAAEAGAETVLLEKTDGPGKKIIISGRTRCNLTNARELGDFIEMYGDNGRFLYNAFNRFFRDDLLSFLARFGVCTRTEADGRIFPASGQARDVLNAFMSYLDANNVRLEPRRKVTALRVEDGRVAGVEAAGGFIPAGAVIVAAGGASYPGTGSSGDGYRLAASLGHTVTKLRPALVPLTVREVELARSMQGVSLRGVRFTVFRCRAGEINPALPLRDAGRGSGEKPAPPVIESRRGDLMFTHFGLSGPVVLEMSLAVYDALERGPVSAAIDLRPDVDYPSLAREIQSRLDRHGKRAFRGILAGMLPGKASPAFMSLTGIPADHPASQVSAVERDRLVALLKSFRFNIKDTLPLSAAMVTAGGVSLAEVDPRTMASRLVRGLYLCGEVLDIDADTGGYNLQAAFSTGFVAGEEAAAFLARGR